MRSLYLMIIACAAIAILSGCATAPPEPKRMLPQRPAAYYDAPAGLTSKEVEMCKLATQRQLEGWLSELPSLCRKAEYNYLGWSWLQAWIGRLYDSIFNRDGSKEDRGAIREFFGV